MQCRTPLLPARILHRSTRFLYLSVDYQTFIKKEFCQTCCEFHVKRCILGGFSEVVYLFSRHSRSFCNGFHGNAEAFEFAGGCFVLFYMTFFSAFGEPFLYSLSESFFYSFLLSGCDSVLPVSIDLQAIFVRFVLLFGELGNFCRFEQFGENTFLQGSWSFHQSR